MRMSDWSSVVCSSDLRRRGRYAGLGRVQPLDELGSDIERVCRLDGGAAGKGDIRALFPHDRGDDRLGGVVDLLEDMSLAGLKRPLTAGNLGLGALLAAFDVLSSEERRVGQECVRTCRSRWAPYL